MKPTLLDTVRVYKNADESIRIVYGFKEYMKEKETVTQFFDRLKTKDLTLDGLEYEEIDRSEIPSDREDRAFWELSSEKKITVNKTKKASYEAEVQARKDVFEKLRVATGLTEEELKKVFRNDTDVTSLTV